MRHDDLYEPRSQQVRGRGALAGIADWIKRRVTEPACTREVAARACGISVDTLDAWRYPKRRRAKRPRMHQPTFRRLIRGACKLNPTIDRRTLEMELSALLYAPPELQEDREAARFGAWKRKAIARAGAWAEAVRRGGHQPPDLAWPYRRQITPEEWERLRTLDESDVRPQGRGRPAVEVLERGVWVACPREAGVVRDAPRRVDRRDYRQRLERNYGNAVVFRELDPGDVSRVLAIGQHRRVRSGHRAYDEETTFARWEARQDPLYVFVHP